MTTNSVRLGVFRDRPVFESAEFGEIIVPAHIAAYAGEGLWGFLQGIATEQGRQQGLFRYDPMTYLLYINRRYWLSESAEDVGKDDEPVPRSRLRPALKAMLEAYGLLEAAVLYSVDDARREFVTDGAKRCLDFQRRGSEASKAQTLAKYARLLGRPVEGTLIPSRLVAPYVALDGWNGANFDDQARLNTASLLDAQTGESLWGVLALSSVEDCRAPSSLELNRLSIGAFDGIGVWVGGLDEYQASVGTLRRYRELILALRTPVWLMFGGYFSLLLGPDGVSDVSHGIYYTESKLVRGAVGSGPAPDRYYVPALHRFYDPVRAFAMVRLLPELACGCRHCGDLDDLEASLVKIGKDAAARIEWTQRLQRHFLDARAAEVRQVSESTRSHVLDEMREMIRMIEQLDTQRRNAIGLTTDHLRTWVRVFA
jgi:hypothetical protein